MTEAQTLDALRKMAAIALDLAKTVEGLARYGKVASAQERAVQMQRSLKQMIGQLDAHG